MKALSDSPSCYSVLEPALNAVELRGAAMAASMPIHYYLFNATGRLLYANQKARAKLQHEGEPAVTASCHTRKHTASADTGKSPAKDSKFAHESLFMAISRAAWVSRDNPVTTGLQHSQLRRSQIWLANP